MNRLRALTVTLLSAVVALVALCGFSCAHAAVMKPSTLSPATGGPVMGYNSWYHLGTGVTEARVLQQASAMVSDGLVAKGYNTMALDAGWQTQESGTRAAASSLVPAASFPDLANGVLAQKLATMGIRLGIYTTIGDQGCGTGIWGSYGHYQQDADMFKSWGVSFVKVDDCKGLPPGTTYAQETALFQQFGTAITADGMQYSEELPVLQPVGSANYTAGVQASSQWASQWRVAPDEHWNDPAPLTVSGHLQDDVHLYSYARPGHWNDLDMVVPGVLSSHPFNWTRTEWQAQLSVWSMEASPLLMSTDLTSSSATEAQAVADLGNAHMIAIDQSGSQASHGLLKNGIQALVKGADGGTAVMLENTGSATASVSLTLAQLGISFPHASALNVWTGKTATLRSVTVRLAPGTASLLVLKSVP